MKQQLAWSVVAVIILSAAISNHLLSQESRVNKITGSVVTDGEDSDASLTPQQAIAAYPELFDYGDERNSNLISALSSISSEFKSRGVDLTQELLAAVMATLSKEVGGTFLPVEEIGDYCAGPNSDTTIGGRRRSEEYDGGCDYKGRGYIQLTHKYNYERYGGPEFLSSRRDECDCVHKKYCANQNCNPAKALKPEYAGKFFVDYYVGRNLVPLANERNFYQVGVNINGGRDYGVDFNEKANSFLDLFTKNPEKTSKLIEYLGTVLPPKKGIITEGFLCPVKKETYPAGSEPALTAAFHSRAYYNWAQTREAEERRNLVDGEHQGIDITSFDTSIDGRGYITSECGAPVYAIADGTAQFKNGERFGGDWIQVIHNGGWKSFYLHVQDFAGNRVGDSKRVKAGDLIGHVGKSATDFCHLHFELLYQNERTDPVPRLQCDLPCGQQGWCECDETLFQGGCNPAKAPIPTTTAPKPVPEKPEEITAPGPTITIPRGVKGFSYAIKPSFKASIDYNMAEEYDRLAEQAKLIAACGDAHFGSDTVKCIEQKSNIDFAAPPGLKLRFGSCDNKDDRGPEFRFCGTSPTELDIYDETAKKAEKKPLQYKFSLYIPYCGDGEVNQQGEECDGGTDCDDTCQST